MTHEDFLDKENKRAIQRDKAYISHLKKLEDLQKRSVVAQETLVKKLNIMLKKVN